MKTLLLFLMAGAVTLAQPTANVSGKWLIEGTPGRGFQRGPQVLTLNQVAGEVTGELTGGTNPGTTAPVNNELWDGKVSGNAITFYVWRGNDRPAKLFYKGELNAAGDQITFTLTGGPPRNPGAPAAANAGAGAQTPEATRQVVAKRAR
jgi:hypothetical protein